MHPDFGAQACAAGTAATPFSRCSRRVRNIEYNGKQYTRYEINRERSQQMYGDPETSLYMDPLKKN